jgi:hypothetical protein
MTDQQISGTRQWQVYDAVPARIPSPRRWFTARRAQAQTEPVLDLRQADGELRYDAHSVLARLEGLRDAGLITNAELEKERRTLLAADGHR